ncbi:MAG: CRISPR-associated endonuclease Cas3'' [Candidatus Verstraetearchaeota archaeon]|nr:CRISPR-associated endonuclease Cas3'' [Candidatus Verstraetearchaeota archaeon]
MAAFAYTNQGLKEHSKNTMEHALRYSNNNYAEVCVKRIKAASKKEITLSPGEFIELVKIAAMLHDAGKAADKYQEQFNGANPEKPSFHLHEIPSAIIAKSLMEGSGYSPDSVLLVSLAVLFHHTAMRPFDEQERRLNTTKKPWIFGRCKTDLNEISRAIFEKEFPSSRIELEEAKSFFEWINRVAGDAEKSRFAKLYCLILNPVIYGDNIDAKSRGGSKKSKFVQELEETIDG